MPDESAKLFKLLCCCGEDHTVRQGGSHVNLVALNKIADWPYMINTNFLIPPELRQNCATAVICDRCLKDKVKIIYAITAFDTVKGIRYGRRRLDSLPDIPTELRLFKDSLR